MTEFQIIRHVRLLNAYPAIFAGIKFAAILANSIAVLIVLIGGGGLGSMIFEGLTNFNTTKILAGPAGDMHRSFSGFFFLENRTLAYSGLER